MCLRNSAKTKCTYRAKEVQWTVNRINSQKSIPRHIVAKLLKREDLETSRRGDSSGRRNQED